MSQLSEQERHSWFSSVLDTVGGLGCTTCLGYLHGISQYSWVYVSPDGHAEVEREPDLFMIVLQLHDSSPIFPEVFGSNSSVTEGRYWGRCPSCGREFRYEYQPKSGDPGCLRLGCQTEPNRVPPPNPKSPPPTLSASSVGPRPSRKPSQSPLPLQATEDVIPLTPEEPPDFSKDQFKTHKTFLSGPPPGSQWAQGLEHKWTARLDLTGVSFQDLIPTPQTLWLEVQSRPCMTLESEVIGLDRSTGESRFRSRGKHLLGANAQLALLRSESKPKGFVGVENARGRALWHLDSQADCMTLTQAGVVASDEIEKHLVHSENTFSQAPTKWAALGESGAWRVKTLSGRGEFWVVEYQGMGRRLEVRGASDNNLLWFGEYAGDEKVYVSTDSQGWLVRFGGRVESYSSDGHLQASWEAQEEMLSLGPRFWVGRQPMDEGSLWGCPEPSLRAGDRQTGLARTLPRDLFPNRTCYLVSGDILWCVCDSQTVLRAYDLGSRKVVREISPLPSGPHSTHSSSKIQFMAAYGTDLYIVSKAGLILAFGT